MRSRAVVAVAAAVVATGVVVAAPAAADTTACTVSDAQAAWLIGDPDLVAEGDATLADGALVLEGGAGVLDPVGPTGSIAFDAEIAYTSAAGVATVLTNPTVVVGGDDGLLLFDVQPEGAGLVPQAALAEVDLRAASVVEGDGTTTLDGVDAATTPTDEGRSVLFSYDTGTLDLAVAADCADTGIAVEPTDAAVPVGDEPADGGGAAGLWIAVGVTTTAAVFAALLAVGSVQRRKRASAASGASAPGPH